MSIIDKLKRKPPTPDSTERPDLTKIKGLSESRRMPRLEKIRLGCKIKNSSGTEYPAELPFFLLPEDDVSTMHGGKIPDIEARAKHLGVTRKDVLQFIKDNGNRLAEELPIFLPMDDTAHTFPQSYKMYGSGVGIKCRGNGEQAEQRIGNTPNFKQVPCPCKNLKTDDNPKGACTIVANLQVILPDVSMGGVYQIDIGSINSIIDINSGIDYARSLYTKATGKSNIAMVPLKLFRAPTETHHGGQKQIHWTCRLIPVGTIDTFAQLAESSKMMLTHADALGGLMLPEPDVTPPQDDAPDMIYEQPAEITAMLDELRDLGSKKLKKGELEDIQTAIDNGDDSAIEAIYNAVMQRLPTGQSAEDVAQKVADKNADPGKKTEPAETGDSVI
jgi:hypothetical protein